MSLTLWTAVPALISVSCLANMALAHDHPVLRGRLIFADHEKPVARMLDLDSGEVSHSFDLPKANPSLVMAEDRRHVVVKTGDAAGTVRILDTGVLRESHGDHDDVEKLPPRLLDLVITGDKPAHVVSDKGWVAIFFDGERPWERKSDPKAVRVELKSLARKPLAEEWKSPAPQHGIAVPLAGGQMLVSLPNAVYAKGEDKSASSRPDRFQILGRKGPSAPWTTSATFDANGKPPSGCELFHGYGAIRGTHVFACKEGEGLLALAQHTKRWTARRIAYPDERRVSTIRGGSGRYLIGNYGSKSPYTALIRIDPAATSLATSDVLPVPGDQSACRFSVSTDGKRLANLTPDGKLRVYDVAPAWKEVASFDAVPAFDCAHGAPTPAPDLAVMDGRAFVSDPANGRIREYNLVTLKQGLDMPVGGTPTALAKDAAGG